MWYEYSKRKQEIDKEAINHAESILSQDRMIDGDDLTSSFWKGAKWADAHPGWHKTKLSDIKYDLPDTINTCYNVILKQFPDEVFNGRFLGNCWIVKGHSYKDDDIIAWIELPKPPKFD